MLKKRMMVDKMKMANEIETISLLFI
jgi:hypothetical protein